MSGAVYMTESLVKLNDNSNVIGHLTDVERAHVLERGRRNHYPIDAYYFRQGDPHNGIHLIESGRVRSFYISPAGREMTLGYWTSGHFIGAPEIFGGGQHMWSSVAVEASSGIWLPGNELRLLILEIPNLALGIIEGLVHKGKCYSALVQLLGTRSMSMRSGALAPNARRQ